MLHQAVETAATQTKPAYAGYQNLDFPLVRAGGLPFGNADAPNVATASLPLRYRFANANVFIAPEFYSEGMVQDVSLGFH